MTTKRGRKPQMAPAPPNRIREFRLARRKGIAELGAVIGLEYEAMRRAETGLRELSATEFMKLAAHLGITPGDLLPIGPEANTASRGLAEDAVPYNGMDKALTAALARVNQHPLKIVSNVVDRAGIKPGDVRIVDYSREAVEAVQSGDIVEVQVFDDRIEGGATTIIRQFLAPVLLCTNSTGENSMPIEIEEGRVVIRGVFVRE